MSKFSEISFCNNTATNIIDEDIKQNILKKLEKDYYVTINNRSFYIISPKNIKFIEKNNYILSVKSIGALYYLFLTKINDEDYCIFIDKKVKNGHKTPRMLLVNYKFSTELFNDTLFEGELLRNNDNDWIYIINDLLIYNKEIMKSNDIIQKFKMVYKILSEYYIRDSYLEICPLYVKKLIPYHEFDYLINQYIPNLNYKCRGIYYEGIKKGNKLPNPHLYLFPRNYIPTKINTPIHSDKKINKDIGNKNIESNSNNIFMLKKTDKSDIYNLYDNSQEFIGIALIDKLHISKKIYRWMKKEDNINVKCVYCEEMKKWKILERIF